MAWAMDETEVMAYGIIFKQFELPEDEHFDFETMRFREASRGKRF